MSPPWFKTGCHRVKWKILMLFILFFVQTAHAQCPTDFVDVSAGSTPRCASVSQGVGSDVSFPEARFLCQSLHPSSDLITLRSSDMLTNDASYETSQNYYVGLTDAFTPGTSVNVQDCSDYDSQLHAQMSSVACTGTCDCWAYNAPAGQLDQQNCLTDTNRFICGIFDDFPELSCPTNWRFIRDRCYRYYEGNDAADFDAAQAVCAAEGGDLARANFYDCNYAAILAGRPNTTKSYLVGLRGNGTTGSEQWRDGTTPSEIFRITGTGDCFLLGDNTVMGQLQPTACSIQPNSFICERSNTFETTAVMETTAGEDVVTTEGIIGTTGGAATTGAPGATATGAPTDEVTTGGDVSATTGRDVTVTTPADVDVTTDAGLCCPENTTAIGDNCFVIIRTMEVYDDAVSSCSQLGGSLARVDPPSEVNQFIVDYFNGDGSGVGSLWIGLRRVAGNPDMYFWESDDTELVDSEAFWGFQQPSGAAGFDCVYAVNVANAQGDWFLTNCAAQFEYICQFDMQTECDDDPCDPSPCDTTGSGNITCTVLGFGNSQCSCEDGFVLESTNGPCIDDPCDPNPCNSTGSGTITCTETDSGMAECSCAAGFLLQTTNGPCIDDPCDPNPCNNSGPGAITCSTILSSGMAECSCETGFVLQTTVGPCIASTTPCDPNPCQNGGVCSIEGSTFSCNCRATFFDGNICTTAIQIGFNGASTSQINEGTSVTRDICVDTSITRSVPISFQFVVSPQTGDVTISPPTGLNIPANQLCVTVTFTAEEDSIAEAQETFQISLQSLTTNINVDADLSQFTIVIPANGDACNPNPCTSGPLQVIQCNNGNCQCPSGYTLSGTTGPCVDVNECADGNNGGCDTTSTTCLNANGTRTCPCRVGFQRQGLVTACSNINECLSTATNNCDVSTTTCLDNVGSFTCPCRDGFENLGLPNQCSNIDECTAGTDNCNSATTECEDNFGSFTCECLGSRVQDTDTNCIDQCTANVDGCDDASTTCTANSDGAAVCNCRAGFESIAGNTTACQEISTAVCCPAFNANGIDYILPLANRCVYFNASNSALANFSTFDSTNCASLVSGINQAGGRLLELAGVETIDREALGEFVRSQLGTFPFPQGIFVDLMRASASSPFRWGDTSQTVLSSTDDLWVANRPSSDNSLNCGAVTTLTNINSDIGYINVACNIPRSAFCGVNPVSCTSALSSRLLIRVTKINGTKAKPSQVSSLTEFSNDMCNGIREALKEQMHCNLTAIKNGSIIAILKVVIPQPLLRRSNDQIKHALRKSRDENGDVIFYTYDGTKIAIDPNGIDVDDLANHQCRPSTCQNGGTCIYDSSFIETNCQCMDGFQGTRCETIKESNNVVILVALALLAVVLAVVFTCCFCCVCVLSKRQKENQKIFKYQPPATMPESLIMPAALSKEYGLQRKYMDAASGADEEFRRSVNFPRVVRNRAVDRGVEMQEYEYDNHGVEAEDYDLESSIDDKRMDHFKKVFFNASQLNARMSSRGDSASSVTSGTSIIKRPLSDILETIEERHEFDRPYTVDGTENI